MTSDLTDAYFESDAHAHMHSSLLPILDKVILRHLISGEGGGRIFDLGCGAGFIANHLSSRYEVVGIDPSLAAVQFANIRYPNLQIKQGSAYDDLAGIYGNFDVVISLEVVEHVADPRCYAKAVYNLLRPGGLAIISTPYHGYIKNCALALSGKMDGHFTALWDGGHIKFWSVKTLTELLREAGPVKSLGLG